MKWLAPLIILVILLIFGAWFCTTHPEPPVVKPPVNANANMANTNTNQPANNTAVVVNANSNMANTANTNAVGNHNASSNADAPVH